MKSSRPFIATFLLLAALYGLWLANFWPGVLGQDSLAVLLQIEEGEIQSQKPVFWYLFVKWLYEPHRLIEVSVAVQLLLSALIFGRILGWCWQQGMRKAFFFLLVFVCLSVPVLYYQSALYSDGLFCAAVAGLTFEAWLIIRARKVGTLSLLYLALLVPVALFFRANGAFMLAILLPLLLCVPNADRLKLGLVFLAWVLLYSYANYSHKSLQRHGSLFPLAIFETVNFLQPHAVGTRIMGLEGLVTPATMTVLERRRPIKDIVAFYDRDYWDPLVYRAAGPAFLSLPKEDKAVIVREFFCCNLWHNLPAFLGSRVNVFMVAALANGGFGGLDETVTIVPQIKSRSQVRPLDLGPVDTGLRAMVDVSFKYRWILWSPFLGIGLLVALAVRGWKRRDWPLVMLMVPLLLQLGGIFLFSIAGEYRYLMLFFTGVVALLPIYIATRADAAGAATGTQASG